jgi:hypothetical protein
MASNLGSAYVTLRANTKLFSRSIALARGTFLKSMAMMRGALVGLSGAFLGLGGLLAGGLAIGAMVKDMMSFEDKMTQALAIMADGSEQLKSQMEAAAMSVGRSTGFAADKAAEAFYFIASALLNPLRFCLSLLTLLKPE